MAEFSELGMTVSDRNTHACCSRPGLSEKLRHYLLSRRAFLPAGRPCAARVVERTPSVTTAGGPSAPQPAR